MPACASARSYPRVRSWLDAKRTGSGDLSPTKPIRRWPSSIRCVVASEPPSTSSTTIDGNAGCGASTSTTGSRADRSRETSSSGGISDTTSSPSERSPRSKSWNACSRRSSDSMSKSIRSYGDRASAVATPRSRSTAAGLVKKGTTTPITCVRRRLVRERPRRRHAGRHLRKTELHRLEVPQRPAELPPLGAVPERVLERPAGDPDRLRRRAEPRHDEALGGLLQPPPLLADQLLGRHRHLGELHGHEVQGAQAHRVRRRSRTITRRGGRHNKRRDAP